MKVIRGGVQKDYRAVWIEESIIKFIDQRLLPEEFEIFEARNHDETAVAIKEMVVRGAPAIGVAASYGIAQAFLRNEDINKVAAILEGTRPTAYDLFYAIDFSVSRYEDGENPVDVAYKYSHGIIEKCAKIGANGEPLIKNNHRILTHCNAGALATVDWGTALAPIRAAHYNDKNIFVFVDETRPRLQGAKLTAWELLNEGIEHAVIVDNAAGHYMSRGEIDMVIVGADRIAPNGDFANKIGTYEKAVLARENGIPFYVAAPVSTFDPGIKNGKEIPIEERGEQEVTEIAGNRLIPAGSGALNPAFDVTPAKYVTGFVTEEGVFKPSEVKKFIGSSSPG